MLRGLVVSPEDVCCYCYCVIVLLCYCVIVTVIVQYFFYFVKRPGCLPRRWFGSSARHCCRCNCSLRRTCHKQILVHQTFQQQQQNHQTHLSSHLPKHSSSKLCKDLPFLDGDAGAVVAGRGGKRCFLCFR